MVSVRKRKMAKSSVKKVSRRRKDKQREIKIASDPIIAKFWDKNLTLQQNYKKMGLTAKLGKQTGGVEKNFEAGDDEAEGQEEALVVASDEEDPYKIPKGRANIIRDEQGEVVKVVHGLKETRSTDAESSKDASEVIKQLESAAQAKTTKERTQSDRETEWISKLYSKYGDDYDKMKWDKKLNIYQQSAGDLKKRVLKWKKLNSIK